MTPGQGRDAPRNPRGKRTSDLGRRLTKARLAAGLTQAQLAETLGVGLTAVRQWESGRAAPRGLYAAAVARFLDEHAARPRGR